MIYDHVCETTNAEMEEAELAATTSPRLWAARCDDIECVRFCRGQLQRPDGSATRARRGCLPAGPCRGGPTKLRLVRPTLAATQLDDFAGLAAPRWSDVPPHCQEPADALTRHTVSDSPKPGHSSPRVTLTQVKTGLRSIRQSPGVYFMSTVTWRAPDLTCSLMSVMCHRSCARWTMWCCCRPLAEAPAKPWWR
jgi:hypothetical protein